MNRPLVVLAGVLCSAGAVCSGSTGVHLSAAQIQALGVQSTSVHTGPVPSVLTLYGRLRADPYERFNLSSPLAGVLQAVPGHRWPQLGKRLISGQLVAEVRLVAPASLQVQLHLELLKLQADLAGAKVAEHVAQAAYRRAKSLYEQNQAVSLRNVQAAQAALATATAQVRADQSGAAAIAREIKKPGSAAGALPLPVLMSGTLTRLLARPGETVAANQPILRIANFHRLLVALALPAGQIAAPPLSTVQVHVLGCKQALVAKPLMVGPRADRQTRGLTLFYILNNPGGLRPGMALEAQMPVTGKPHIATLIPRSAVIWWQGRRWVFADTGAGNFALTPLVGASPAVHGYLVIGFKAHRVVTSGAQILLSKLLARSLKKSG
ncbi:MAG: HlyD family efflux transporter periplasmic adaptor subunit [Phycisphaerales bacterium]|nr:HlyD family efflux transporter periplasmic adaptor subunit [Phycisphaerales bacterium]